MNTKSFTLLSFKYITFNSFSSSAATFIANAKFPV